jgi:hypothetical protein
MISTRYGRIQLVRSARHNFWLARLRKWRREAFYWALAMFVAAAILAGFIELGFWGR